MKKNIYNKLENDVPMPKGGKANGVMKVEPVEMTPCNGSQTVEVRGTKRMLASKSKKATWY
ncbi:MAG: hypothetical protein P1U29_06120 [Candidatus Pelagibacter bacterium]|nr:hypothetical protein [Candidatus Pelagibacter bacterium]